MTEPDHAARRQAPLVDVPALELPRVECQLGELRQRDHFIGRLPSRQRRQGALADNPADRAEIPQQPADDAATEKVRAEHEGRPVGRFRGHFAQGPGRVHPVRGVELAAADAKEHDGVIGKTAETRNEVVEWQAIQVDRLQTKATELGRRVRRLAASRHVLVPRDGHMRGSGNDGLDRLQSGMQAELEPENQVVLAHRDGEQADWRCIG